ncbi:SMP-30/gluconolactonase/LRE family protein [uncultured Litoreibacter sp.]|uniref:SMP-30/gluconolactonase/LRE family protein n=1 Tax=uncultured Litoreibacter sp. TaxID=1392394 RepID=UPI00260C1559|nr:SMP-30/gluconolactonase/LRE family protein [uncultured Litoreibacter sp.]
MSPQVHDDRACLLGEGPFWHPKLGKLFWCDILGRKLLCDDGREWAFEQHVSAMGWVSDTQLLIADEVSLFTFDLESAARSKICNLEADNPVTRSNDGRADPYGGFWIGTMGKQAEPDAGAIYRYYKGELRRLFAPITISNAICFSPDGAYAYFTDTYYARVMRVPLDPQGWPCAAPDRILDLSKKGLNPDGAITTADGDLLIAQWGASNVAQYGRFGDQRRTFDLPTAHVTCPVFGGPDMSTLFVTTAQQGLSDDALLAQPDAGKTFAFNTALRGLAAPQVLL